MATIVTRSGKGSALTTAEMDANLTNLNSDKLENTVEDTTPQLGGDLDVNSNSIVSTSNGSITLAPDGNGSVIVNASVGGLDIKASPISTTTTNGNISLAPNGTGVVFINNGLEIINDYGSSGFGILSGHTSTGLALRTNLGAGGATDPQIALSNGGGISMTAGATSTTTFNGTNVSNLQIKDYKETVHDLGTTSGTITPDVANGNVQTIELDGNLTFSAFANAEAGQSMTLIVDTNGTGRTLTSTMKFSGGTKTLSTTDTFDIISVFYDGTTYFASLSTNFS
tara:strand:+ start:1551 stop:2399 length:849 start_codon:yes stop_codon:yes gene_type:complete